MRWRPDGELEFLGRADTQIKINGLRIELGEIEAHLDTVPGITGAAVVVRPDKFGVNRLYSYATSQDGAARPGFDQIRAAEPFIICPRIRLAKGVGNLNEAGWGSWHAAGFIKPSYVSVP